MTFYALLMTLTSILMTAYVMLVVYQIKNTYSKSVTSNDIDKSFGVSIVIPFKNEENRIAGLISDLENLIGMEENREVIFVNDHSDDGSVSLINELASFRYKILSSKAPGKKSALKTGVQEAAFEVIATLDADIRISENWLLEVRRFFSKKDNGFLILPILTSDEKNFQGHFEALDVLALAGTTLSWANGNNAMMCNGANMAFKKQLFDHYRGNESDGNLVSGDDMFFLHQVKNDSNFNIGAVFNTNTIARTSAFNSFKELLNQRARWTSKSHYYSDNTTLTVAWLVLITNLMVLLLAIGSLWYNKLINLFLIVFATKFIIDFIYLLLLAIKFKKTNSLIYYPLAVIIQFIFVPLVFVKSKWGKFEWKGRSYNR